MKTLGIIPARFASTRYPGKPLAMINGKSMIRRVYEQATKASLLHEVVVATDDTRIQDEVKSFGGHVVLTRTDHVSGTDRCYEALKLQNTDFDAVVNIQGDEPFIQPEQIDQVVSLLENKNAGISTLAFRIQTEEELFNPNTVKVVFTSSGKALYFSRHAIPYLRNIEPAQWLSTHRFYKHLGIYGYLTSSLKAINLLVPSTLEKAESLEQLRWLENGIEIAVGITTTESVGIDTPADLEKVLKLFT
ncbi:MAG: 3-deoxy-manno-octulosonate cytidylyltransferase [Bacteroidales bacterium]|nr:3-deoxy-manno-octulosonate cytidylyltransferase [Bacteroidales bacterium]